MTSTHTSVRFQEPVRVEIRRKMSAYGFTQLSPFLTFAVRQLRMPENTEKAPD